MKTSKEIEKRILFKKTLNEMNRYINGLQEQKKKYLETARVAKEKGLAAQLNLALSALKNVMLQEQRAQEMLLNFEITNNMKDMSQMTSSFLKGMGDVSKEMIKLTHNKDFKNVQKDFEKAIIGLEIRTEEIDAFLDMNQSTFQGMSSNAKIEDEDILSLINDQNVTESNQDEDIDAAIKKVRAKMTENE